MSATDIFSRLREEIKKTDRSLLYLADKSTVPYHRIYRFVNAGVDLSLHDADTLFIFLTGSSFIAIPNND